MWQAVYMIPSRVQKQANVQAASGEGAESSDLTPLKAAFDKMKKMGDAFVESAMIEASRPPEVPLADRRFAPKEKLQTEGASRALLLLE